MICTSSSHSICVQKKKKSLEKTPPESNKQSGERQSRLLSSSRPADTHKKSYQLVLSFNPVQIKRQNILNL